MLETIDTVLTEALRKREAQENENGERTANT
jgi:hypothetical protein